VVRLQNLFDSESLLGQAISAELAHAHAVAPAASGEDESGDAIAFAVDTIDHEQLFLQTQSRANTPAANMSDTLRAYHFEVDHSPRRSAGGDAQVGNCADPSDRASQACLHRAERKFCRPVRER